MKQPNILLIVTDQHRLSALGCYGPTQCRTPNIDRIAREGVRFETAYTTAPVCSPARASIITGQYPSRHGVTMNCGGMGPVWNIPDHPRMLSRRLIGQGYRCGYTGKWHLCPEVACTEWFNQKIPHHVPSTLGFEGQDFMGHGGSGFRYEEYRSYLKEAGLEFQVREGSANPASNGWPHFGVLAGPKEGTVDHFLVDHTLSLLDRYKDASEPFFIWHNHWGPHERYYPVEEFFEGYRDMEIPPWPNFHVEKGSLGEQHLPRLHPSAEKRVDWNYWQRALRHYYAFTTQIDFEIGRLLNHLENTGQLDDTIIIFTSDHGETLGSHGGMIDKGYSHFEEIQRIGMIIRYPEKYLPPGVRPGTVRKDVVSLLDVYPTCLDLAGVPAEEIDAEGLSLHSGTPLSREEVFVEFFGLALPTVMVTCRRGNWKYGCNPNATDELYNLQDDPHEMRNLVHHPEYRTIRREMLERLESHLPKLAARNRNYTQAHAL